MNLPKEIQNLIEGQDYTIDKTGMSGSTILIFQDKVLKIQPETEETASERCMMKWMEGKLPVPKILCAMQKDGKSYLLMTRISGKMSCAEEYMEKEEFLVKVLAESLKKLWEVDITDCPAVWNLDVKLKAARKNVEQNLVDVDNVEPETFGEGGFKDPQDLWNWLEQNRPKEDLVLSHGDFCLPNIFIENGKLAGFIDLGRMGAADRWQDIALCYRSLKHNFGGEYGGKVYENFRPERLFEALGIEPDWEKLKYYTLMDELF